MPASRPLTSAASTSNRGATIAAGLAIAVGSALTVGVPGAFGLLSLPGLAVLLIVSGSLGAAVLWNAPALLVVAVPALLPSPMLALTYAWELLLFALAALVVLQGVRSRAPWLTRLSTVECVLLVFTAWGVMSFPWIFDDRTYVIGARRILTGVVALWVGLRLARIAPVALFEWGIVLASFAMSGAAMARSASTGFSVEQLLVHRTEATNMGWGQANFIATLLLLLFPSVLEIAFHRRGPIRLLAWAAVVITTAMQIVIAARGATILFVLGVLIQTVRLRNRRGWWTALGGVMALALVFASKPGQQMLSRFTSLREMGSMTIRIWYWREAWVRMVEHLPFGMGLGQGWASPDKLQGMDPHEFWLSVTGDHGIPGLVLWVAVLVLLWRRVARARFVPGAAERVRALLVGMGLTLVHVGIESTYNGTQFLFIFFWLIGGSIGYFEAEAAAAEAPAAASSRL